MSSKWEEQDENPATHDLVRCVHDMPDGEFADFCKFVWSAMNNGEEVVRGVPVGEVYNLVLGDADYRRRLRKVQFPLE